MVTLSTQKHGRAPSPDFRPLLEALEDRCAFAVDVATGAVAVPAVEPAPEPAAPAAPAAVSQAVLLQTLSAGDATAQPAPDSAALLTSTLPGPEVPPPTAEVPSAFAGRVVLPGTGVQARAATGDGPLTQPPGLFLVGGSNEQDVVAAAAPAAPPRVTPLSAPEAAGDGQAAAADKPDAEIAIEAWLADQE